MWESYLLFSGTKWVLSAHLSTSHLTSVSWLKESHLLRGTPETCKTKFIQAKKEGMSISWNKFELPLPQCIETNMPASIRTQDVSWFSSFVFSGKGYKESYASVFMSLHLLFSLITVERMPFKENDGP